MPGAFHGATLAFSDNVPVATPDKSVHESPLTPVLAATAKTSEMEGGIKEQVDNPAGEQSRNDDDDEDDLYAQPPKPATSAQPKQMSMRERLDMLASGSKDASVAAGQRQPEGEKNETAKASPSKANEGELFFCHQSAATRLTADAALAYDRCDLECPQAE